MSTMKGSTIDMSRNHGSSNKEEKASLAKVHKIKSGTSIELSCVSDWRGEKVRKHHKKSTDDDKINNFFVLVRFHGHSCHVEAIEAFPFLNRVMN